MLQLQFLCAILWPSVEFAFRSRILLDLPEEIDHAQSRNLIY